MQCVQWQGSLYRPLMCRRFVCGARCCILWLSISIGPPTDGFTTLRVGSRNVRSWSFLTNIFDRLKKNRVTH